MNILVVGAGIVGQALASQLSSEGHQVTLIDRNRRLIRELGEKLDVLGIVGNAAMPSVLEKAGIQSTDVLIAVTNVDEVNLVVGMMACKLGVPHRVVRIRNPEYAKEDGVLSMRDLGIEHVINPDPVIVEAIVRMVEIPGCNEFVPIGNGQVQMLGFTVDKDSPAVGRSLAELRELAELNALLILYITRKDTVLVPRGDDVVQPGDRLHVLVSRDTVPFVLPIIYRSPPETDHVIISGASRIGVALADALAPRVKRVVMIESDEHAAEEAATHLKRTTVLQGDGTELSVLQEGSIDRCDLFCALSDDDQRNMLSALLAKKHGAKRVAVLVHQPEFVPVLDSLGMETVINPRLATVSEILMYVRRGQINSVTRLAESEAEIIEMVATENCPAVRKPLGQLRFPRNALIGAILRDDVMVIASGNTVIQPDDHVVIYALPDAITRIEKLFTQRK